MATVVSVDDRTLQEVLRVDSEGRLLVAVKGGGGGNVDLSNYPTKGEVAATYLTKAEGADFVSQNQLQQIKNSVDATAAAQIQDANNISALQTTTAQNTEAAQRNADDLSRIDQDTYRKAQVDIKVSGVETKVDGLVPRVAALEARPPGGGGGGGAAVQTQIDTLVWDAGASRDGIFNRWHENNLHPNLYGTWTKSPAGDATFTPSVSGLYEIIFWFNVEGGATRIILTPGVIQGAVFSGTGIATIPTYLRLTSGTAVRVQLRTTYAAARVASVMVRPIS